MQVHRSKLLLALVLAGCLQSSPPTDPDDGGDVRPAAPTGTSPWTFDCSGAAITAGDACASTTSMDGDQWAEPFVAAHPSKDIFIIAAQGRAGPSESQGPILDAIAGVTAECLTAVNCLFITHDRGATWERSEAITPDGDRIYIDSTLAWADDVLLVAGLVPNGPGIRVLTSLDDGLTFTSATVFAPSGKDDRPWLAAQGQEVALVWQESGSRRGFLALSHDAGSTWDAVLELPCSVHSNPVWWDGWWIACGDDKGTLIYKAQGGRVERISMAHGHSGTRMLARLAGGLVLSGATTATVQFSGDGISWSQSIPLAPDVPLEDRWMGWMTSDGERILAMVWDQHGGCSFCAENKVTRELVQADLHGIVARHDLNPSHGWGVEGAGAADFGEFDGIACRDVCLVAWPDEGRIAHAWLAPP